MIDLNTEKLFLHGLWFDNKLKALKGYIRALEIPSRDFTVEDDKKLKAFAKELVKKMEKRG